MLTILFSKFLMLFITNLHPFHVTVSEIYHNQKNHSLEITMKLFVDDFEKAINSNHDQELNLYEDYNEKTARQFIASYIKGHFVITLNKKSISLNYLGSEIENDAIWCYLEAKEIGTIDDFQITSKILLDIYDDQMNLVHFEEKDKIKSFQLYADNETGHFDTSNW